MLNISESPKTVAAFSWSRVLDASPHWTSWLMPHQWSQYLARLMRAKSAREMAGLAMLSAAADNGSRINISSELLVAETDGWGSMVERARATEIHGFSTGLAQADAAEAWSAGNAVCPSIAQWIAEILNRS